MTKAEQIAYIANVAFADALGSAADDCHTEDVDSKRIYNKLCEDGFAGPCQEITHEALRYKMQQQFVDFARQLLDKVQDSPHWQFLMAVAGPIGKREALYLLYMTAVGSGVGYADRKWVDIVEDIVDAPEMELEQWTRHFTHRGRLGWHESPMVNWPLRDARPWRKAP